MKILVTGGSGFIGSYFIERLSSEGHELVILDLIDPPAWYPRHTYKKGDVRDPAAVKRAMAGCDRVIHLAAAHHDFGIEHDTYYAVNETGSRVLCDGADELGVRDITFYSTVAVYGDAPEPHHEDSPTAPNSPYGGSKLKGEAVFRAWTEKGGGRRALIIRPTVTFGVRNFANMYSLIRQIASGRYLEFGEGGNIKSLSYVENIVEATLFLLGKPAGELAPFEVFNYIDKPDLTSRQITHAVYLSLGKGEPRFTMPMWVGLLLALPFDIVIALTGKNLPISSARLKKLYEVQTKFEADKLARAGYTPRIPLVEGIDKMVKWYLAEGKNQTAEWHQPPKDVVVVAG
ncbi:MAG: NAD(P)-dependent oxidoreductase [Phycisphaerales bacterium]|nr:NAD(P)-dependent oxidoreductase [Phycisphaerales bacterium]